MKIFFWLIISLVFMHIMPVALYADDRNPDDPREGIRVDSSWGIMPYGDLSPFQEIISRPNVTVSRRIHPEIRAILNAAENLPICYLATQLRNYLNVPENERLTEFGWSEQNTQNGTYITMPIIGIGVYFDPDNTESGCYVGAAPMPNPNQIESCFTRCQFSFWEHARPLGQTQSFGAQIYSSVIAPTKIISPSFVLPVSVNSCGQ